MERRPLYLKTYTPAKKYAGVGRPSHLERFETWYSDLRESCKTNAYLQKSFKKELDNEFDAYAYWNHLEEAHELEKRLACYPNIGIITEDDWLTKSMDEIVGLLESDLMKYMKGRQMRIFISGPITGTKDYLERFATAERKLSRQGYKVINPAKIVAVVPVELSWNTCMDITLALLKACDAVYMLKGWEQSAGATMEHINAEKLGLEIEYEKETAASDEFVPDNAWQAKYILSTADEV